MPSLSSTLLAVLKHAAEREAQAAYTFQRFAHESLDEYWAIAQKFLDLAAAETKHEYAVFEFMDRFVPPVIDPPIGSTFDNVSAAIAQEEDEAQNVYPDYARTARAEGRNDIGDFFDRLAFEEAEHANELRALAASMIL